MFYLVPNKRIFVGRVSPYLQNCYCYISTTAELEWPQVVSTTTTTTTKTTTTTTTTSPPPPSSSPPPPPQRRQRLKGIKHNHQWWQSYWRHNAVLVKEVHQTYFRVAQYIPNKHYVKKQPKKSKENSLTYFRDRLIVDCRPNYNATPNLSESILDVNKTQKSRHYTNPYDDLVMAFITTKRQFGKRAVDRNRARRRVKAAARKILLNQLDTSFWYTVTCRSTVNDASHKELCEELEQLKDPLSQEISAFEMVKLVNQ